MRDELLKACDEMVELQRTKLMRCGERIIPNLTSEDILQPNDYPELESNPEFRYEEGVLEGLMSARAALLAIGGASGGCGCPDGRQSHQKDA